MPDSNDLTFRPNNHDLLRRRPYYVVSVEADTKVEDFDGDIAAIREHIASHAVKTEADVANAPQGTISDVFVSSHGWHRNLFKALAAYDRLHSRLSVLMHRGRISAPPDFRPLFINLHWHSDFGEDGWVDLDGRHDLDSFIENVSREFEVPPGEHQLFHNDFESMFQYMATASAPDINALDDSLQDRAAELMDVLEGYAIKDAPTAHLSDKISLLWRCYVEAKSRVATGEQTRKPSPFLSPTERLMAVLSFLVKVAGPVALIGLIKPLGIWDGLASLFGKIAKANPHLVPILTWPWVELSKVAAWLPWVALIVVVDAACLLSLLAAQKKNSLRADKGEGKRAARLYVSNRLDWKPRPLGPFGILAWAVSQLIHVAPLLVVVLLTYLHPLSVAAIAGVYCAVTHTPLYPWPIVVVLVQAVVFLLLFPWPQRSGDERVGRRGIPPSGKDYTKWKNRMYAWDGRFWLAKFASTPAKLAGGADLPTSRMFGLWDLARAQLDISEMQKRAVEASYSAANFMERLLAEVPEVKTARVHLIGHSFGGLLVVNLARHLCGRWAATGSDRKLATVCPIQGAFASNWFDGEDEVLDRVTGCVAAVYTQYDSATGFLYNAGFGGRNGAGNVGLCLSSEEQTKKLVRFPLPSASLTWPPDFGHRIELATDPATITPPLVPVPALLNVDCSRFEFEGSVASGGAHDDVYKDDVVLTLWGVAGYGLSAPESEDDLTGSLFVAASTANEGTDLFHTVQSKLATQGIEVKMADPWVTQNSLWVRFRIVGKGGSAIDKSRLASLAPSLLAVADLVAVTEMTLRLARHVVVYCGGQNLLQTLTLESPEVLRSLKRDPKPLHAPCQFASWVAGQSVPPLPDVRHEREGEGLGVRVPGADSSGSVRG